MEGREGPRTEAPGADAEASPGEALIRAAPGLARIYATLWWHTAEWTVSSSLRATSRLLRDAVGGGSPADLVEAAESEVRDYARRLLGRDDRPSPASEDGDVERPRPETALREQGAELLRRSADVHEDEEIHPAYARILDVLAPDEARILRLLATGGAQPSVDVRAGLPLVSELVAPGRSMIGAEAGLRHPDRVPAYLNNLYRLGLIWFSREPIRERLRYQVLEAQPEVVEAIRKGGRTARTVRRSILLTPFGRDFCDLCLPLDGVPDLEGAESPSQEEPGESPAGEAQRSSSGSTSERTESTTKSV